MIVKILIVKNGGIVHVEIRI